MPRTLRTAILPCLALAALLLGACGKHEAAAPPAQAPAATHTAARPSSVATAPAVTTATPAPAASAGAAAPPLAVTSLTLGSAINADYKVTRPGTRFATDQRTLYASVATTGRSEGATLNAKWSYLEGQGQLVSSISQSIATDGPAVTTFKVHNPDLWPAGKYRVEISLDGMPVAKQDFEVAGRR